MFGPMGYREDLEAAMARVAALESELGRAQSDDKNTRLTHLRAELESAKEREGKLKAELTNSRRRLEALERERRGENGNASFHSMPSLFEFNRNQTPLGGRNASVLCPFCLETGQQVEMKRERSPLHQDLEQDQVQQVYCPRCAYVGWMRIPER